MSSQKKWLWVGIAISIINSLAGAIVGVVLWQTEPKLKNQGQIITVVAVALFVAELALVKFWGPQLGLIRP